MRVEFEVTGQESDLGPSVPGAVILEPPAVIRLEDPPRSIVVSSDGRLAAGLGVPAQSEMFHQDRQRRDLLELMEAGLVVRLAALATGSGVAMFCDVCWFHKVCGHGAG